MDRDRQERWNAMIIPFLLGDAESLRASVEKWNERESWSTPHRNYLIDRITEKRTIKWRWIRKRAFPRGDEVLARWKPRESSSGS